MACFKATKDKQMEAKDYERFIKNAEESIEDCDQKLEYWLGQFK